MIEATIEQRRDEAAEYLNVLRCMAELSCPERDFSAVDRDRFHLSQVFLLKKVEALLNL
ncbi:hypothetical protein D9M68_879130 [compost metagenome]